MKEKLNSFDDLLKIKDQLKLKKEEVISEELSLDDLENNETVFLDSNKETISNEKIEQENQSPKKDVYLIGGSDAEMRVIKKRLKKSSQEYFDKELKWGAKIEDYSEQISRILDEGGVPVAIELAGAETIEGIVDIDHHNEKSDRPASLLQVMDRIGLKPSLFDDLIAANDSGFIPAMEKEIEKYRYQIENSKGEKELFETLKKKWIAVVRKIDRKEQGITPEQEKRSEEAIKSREDFYDGTLSIVRLPHSKCATVTDRLYGTYENLFIPSEDGESNFYGNGKLCQELKDKYEGSWAGGSGLRDKLGNAYWGGYPDQNEAETFIKEKVKEISESFARFDKIFTPENAASFTELGKKIYELGSFERMNESVEVSNVRILDGGKDFIIKLQPKQGWSIFSINREDLVGGFQKFKDRVREGQKTFGFSGENELMPMHLFIKDGEEIPTQIQRGLKREENFISEKSSWDFFQKNYEIVKKLPVVENSIKIEIEKIDPRLLEYSLGRVDISGQKNWEISGGTPETGYFNDLGDHSDFFIKNSCNDFKLLGVDKSQNIKKLESLKNGELEISTAKLGEISQDSIKTFYESLEQKLDQFESPLNQKIQENKIEYLKRVYLYVKKQEEEIERIKSDPEFMNQFFSKASIEKPLEFGWIYEDLEKLNTFLKDKVVATYQTYSGSNYSESVRTVGQYSSLEYLSRGSRLSFYDFNNAIKTIDSGVSFSADTFAVDKIAEALEKAGYEVEGRGRSGFKSRNSFIVLLPKVSIDAHIIKSGDAINGENIGSQKVWYCGKTSVEINDQNKREEILRIIEDVRQGEKNKQIQEFITDFKLNGDGTTGFLKTGGEEKYQSVPDRFKVLASMRIANTADHRQNRGHTYENMLLDTEAIKGQKSITIRVPDNMKGLVIGKGGSNIKRISEELGLSIKII